MSIRHRTIGELPPESAAKKAVKKAYKAGVGLIGGATGVEVASMAGSTAAGNALAAAGITGTVGTVATLTAAGVTGLAALAAGSSLAICTLSEVIARYSKHKRHTGSRLIGGAAALASIPDGLIRTVANFFKYGLVRGFKKTIDEQNEIANSTDNSFAKLPLIGEEGAIVRVAGMPVGAMLGAAAAFPWTAKQLKNAWEKSFEDGLSLKGITRFTISSAVLLASLPITALQGALEGMWRSFGYGLDGCLETFNHMMAGGIGGIKRITDGVIGGALSALNAPFAFANYVNKFFEGNEAIQKDPALKALVPLIAFLIGLPFAILGAALRGGWDAANAPANESSTTVMDAPLADWDRSDGKIPEIDQNELINEKRHPELKAHEMERTRQFDHKVEGMYPQPKFPEEKPAQPFPRPRPYNPEAWENARTATAQARAAAQQELAEQQAEAAEDENYPPRFYQAAGGRNVGG